MTLSQSLRLQDCYKIIVNTIFDWRSYLEWGANYPFYGILDYCGDSDDEQVSLYTYNPIPKNTETYWVGKGLHSTNCYPGKIWPWWLPMATRVLNYSYGLNIPEFEMNPYEEDVQEAA